MIYIIILLILLILFIILNKYISNHQNYKINENYTNEKIPYILFKTGPYDIPTNELETIFIKIKIN